MDSVLRQHCRRRHHCRRRRGRSSRRRRRSHHRSICRFFRWMQNVHGNRCATRTYPKEWKEEKEK